MISLSLARLRERLLEAEGRLAVARRARNPASAVVAALHADATALRAQIAAAKRARLERSTP